MENKKKSISFKNKIILGLAFVLFISTFMYSSCINIVWDDYEAIDSFSGNGKHFDKIAEIVLEHSQKTKCDCYLVRNSKIYGSKGIYDDSKLEINLSVNDKKSLDKATKTLEGYMTSFYVREYGIYIPRDGAKICGIIYIYKDINVNDINSDFIKEPSDYLAFKKIEGNWYNVLRKSCFH